MIRNVCAVLLLLTACGGESAPVAPVPAVDAPAAPSPAQIDAAAGRVLAPSPLELDKAVRAAGVADSLGALVPERTYQTTAGDPGTTAVRTGVLLADTVFTGASASNEELVAKATTVRDGLRAIGATEALVGQIDDMNARLLSGAATRDDLLAEVDGITSIMVPEEGWGPEDRSGPLVQAGVWLESAHLVAAACVDKQDAAAATTLLRDPEIVAYFLQYLESKGTTHAPSPVVDQLVGTLKEMQSIASKDQLNLDDTARIRDLTGAVLTLL